MKKLKNPQGQAVMESLMMIAVIFAVWLALTASLRKMQFFERVFGTPWAKLSNTMEFGMPVAQKSSAGINHPTSFKRHSTLLNQ